jgi:hypothetical protein
MPSVQFKEVEVIELPFVAGENHPSNFLEGSENHSSNAENTSFPEEKRDSAAIALAWEAQTRTKVDIETFEQEKAKKKKGKLKRLSRAVRKGM